MTIVLLPAVSGTRVWSIVDTDGNEHVLSESTHYLPTLGPSGLWQAELDFRIDALPFAVESQLKKVNVRPRSVDFPIYIDGSSELMIHERMRALISWLNGSDGDSYLRVTSPDGAERQLQCRGSVAVSESQDARFPQQGQMVVASLTCPQPYWEDADPQIETYELSETPATWFGRPWFPFTLASSTVLAAPTIQNDGDIETFPVWTFTGPGSNPTVRNHTTGQVLSVTYDIPAGGQVVIDTRTSVKSITDGLGTNLFGLRTAESVLWAIGRGTQRIQVELADATLASRAELSYRRRYLAP